uniref:Uncharacterized protein n=1 Tax=Arundo donax TaxID=35708 RepID=A0A0A8ZQE6_ARUDO
MLISHVKFPELQIIGRYGSHLESRTKQTIHPFNFNPAPASAAPRRGTLLFLRSRCRPSLQPTT